MASSSRRSCAADLSEAFCCSMAILLWKSISASSVGGSPSSALFIAPSSAPSRSSFCAVSFMAVAWYILSSETVAIILRVTSLILDWKTLTFWARPRVSCRPSMACWRSLSDRAVTSSRINSFSSKASFLSDKRSSKKLIFALRVSWSGSLPARSRCFRMVDEGVSSSSLSCWARFRTAVSCSCSLITSSRSLGTSGMRFRVTCSWCWTTDSSTFKLLTSSSR
mmetsp:Transcript_36702/g.82618  ORF Transcript_36702/g.82618 Transcript_36702/m.82618 type:complete len:223 (+) Transcript_36702:283-951(+)